MRALRFHDGEAHLEMLPAPEAGPGEALVRVHLAGICGTDLELAAGYMDFGGIPGHEFCGTVMKASDPAWVGKRVTGEINVSCGACRYCLDDMERHCSDRTVLGISGRNGAFAEFLTLPVNNLHGVPDHVPDEAAVFTEPLAAAHRIIEQTKIAPGTRSLVLGDGPLGLLCAAALQRAGSPPVVCGRHPDKLAVARSRGLPTVLGIGELGREFDLVVEATGSPEAIMTAAGHIRPGGLIVLKSTYHGTGESNLTPIVVDEIDVLGSRCGPFPPAIEHLASDPGVVDGLVSATYPLEMAADAFRHARRREALKILLEI